MTDAQPHTPSIRPLAEVDRGDLEWGTIPGLLASTAARYGDRDGIVDGDTTLTWAEVAERTAAAARAFMSLGIEPGDRVAIWAPNMWEWVVTAIGAQAAGAVLVPLNTRYKGPEAAYVINRSKAKVLATVGEFLGTDYLAMLADADPTPSLVATVVLRGEAAGDAISCTDFLARGDTVAIAEYEARVGALTGDDLSDMLFTSGTTGAPKGVMCTHSQVLRGFADWASIVGLREDDRYLVINPFFHSFGYKAGIVSGMAAGCTLVPQAVFDVDEAMRLIAAQRISMIPGPPTLYQTILNHPAWDRSKMGTLRLAVTGAAAVPVSLIERMRNDMGFDTVVTAYGLTEACGIATVCRADDPPEVISATSGRAIPGVEVIVADDNGAEMPPGEPGEVLVRGYNVMVGYFDDPEQTAEAIDSDGWLHTGDIGVATEDGYIQITDRKKDMFIVGGFNAYPAEIENLMLRHPDLSQVSVIGVPDERMGEVGHAYVIARHGATVDADALIAWCRDNMANYKVPRAIHVVDALPTNPAGKVKKFELRAAAGETATS